MLISPRPEGQDRTGRNRWNRGAIVYAGALLIAAILCGWLVYAFHVDTFFLAKGLLRALAYLLEHVHFK